MGDPRSEKFCLGRIDAAEIAHIVSIGDLGDRAGISTPVGAADECTKLRYFSASAICRSALAFSRR